MRPIKFRVLFEVTNRDFTKSILIHYTSLERLTDDSDNFDYQAVKVISKEQFTGLTDKNGVDIYEGDIVNYKDSFFVGAVYFNEGEYLIKTDISTHHLITYCGKYLEIIGNIHQSPELLELS